MLLCVGTLFSAGDDCKTQWQRLIDGQLKGKSAHGAQNLPNLHVVWCKNFDEENIGEWACGKI